MTLPTTINLPTPENNSGTNDWSDVYSNDKALREAVQETNVAVNATAHPLTWYEPKVIATEQSRESTSFGTLATADEITGVVVPANGKLIVNYRAKVKSSVAGAGRVSLFLGATAISGPTGSGEVEATIGGTAFGTLRTESNGSFGFTEGIAPADVSTGFVIGGSFEVFVAAGTYTVSARYRATSGSVTAKERKLWVEVHGT